MEDTLVSWFKTTFRSRTGTTNPYDADLWSRVPWSEIRPAMERLGYTGSVVDLRYQWHDIFTRRQLRRWCLRTERKARPERG